MAYTTIFNNVVFVEGENNLAQLVCDVSSDTSFQFGSQLKNLNDIKAHLAYQAYQQGCNCIVRFAYGQKSRWLALDDVAFWGRGVAARLQQDAYDEIVKTIAARENS
jgi:hypothetical protein